VSGHGYLVWLNVEAARRRWSLSVAATKPAHGSSTDAILLNGEIFVESTDAPCIGGDRFDVKLLCQRSFDDIRHRVLIEVAVRQSRIIRA
jgi:hypothetical protein